MDGKIALKGKEQALNNKKTFSFCEGLFVRGVLLIFLFYSCISYNSIIQKLLTLSQSTLQFPFAPPTNKRQWAMQE